MALERGFCGGHLGNLSLGIRDCLRSRLRCFGRLRRSGEHLRLIRISDLAQLHLLRGILFVGPRHWLYVDVLVV